MSGGNRRPRLTTAQAEALAELTQIATDHPNSLKIVANREVDSDGALRVVVELPTGDLPEADGGLVANEREQVTVTVGVAYPLCPPSASVDHQRFLDTPHVLQGERLCVYLDPSREWRPSDGVAGFLERLWQWFADAIAARFDPRTALYHAVGGVLHRSPGAPTIVVRHGLPKPVKTFRRAIVRARTATRLDLAWAEPTTIDETYAAVITSSARLPLGLGLTLPALVTVLNQHAGIDEAGILSYLATTATRNPSGSELYFGIVVDLQNAGDHLLFGRLDAATTDVLRRLVSEHGALLSLTSADVPAATAIQWCATSDERPGSQTRRDHARPVAAFQGKTIHIWGCGGLGSWIAEFVARAGAQHIFLSDPATSLTGGLLVRQNFTEEDIGRAKVDALADRIRAVSDNVVVTTNVGMLPTDASLSQADLIIDATVNAAIRELLHAQVTRVNGPQVATVATDVATGTLGLLIVTSPDCDIDATTIDELTGRTVLERGDLEGFHAFWAAPDLSAEVVPQPGCSVPTFHGSAADMASLAGSFVSFIGAHLDRPVAGAHLLALPHAPGGPAHHFLPADALPTT